MMYGGDGWMWNGGWGWGGWILMTLVMVAFWGLVITAVVLAIRYLASGRQPPQPRRQRVRASRQPRRRRAGRTLRPR